MITLLPEATKKVREFLTAQDRDDLALRIFVKPGGCSGFSYGMGLDEPKAEDHVTEVEGIKVVVDPGSLKLVSGAVVDFKNSMLGGGFAITNPNAASSCGCGSSFRPKDADEVDASDDAVPAGAACGTGGCC